MCKNLRKLFKRSVKPVTYAGAQPAMGDVRTIQLSSLIAPQNMPILPGEYLVDNQFRDVIPNPMYANDVYGDCVIAGRAHMTRRFEYIEQNVVIPITDKDVVDQYFKESNGRDVGLFMLQSLNQWRSGWPAAGRTYSIYAFAKLNHLSRLETQASVYLLHGVYAALNMSMSTPAQWAYGNPWTYCANDSILFNHCVYVCGYDEVGPICVTWGKIQHMTWEYWDKMCTEAYAIIDAANEWMASPDSAINLAECQRRLNLIQNIPPETIVPVSVKVIDKNGAPVKNAQVCVFKDEVVAQTYAYTDKTGVAYFAALYVGQLYQISASYQAANNQVTFPVTVNATFKFEPSSLTIQLMFDYPWSAEYGKLIL